jgi:uncharacterized protein YegP (UPF0339 family)
MGFDRKRAGQPAPGESNAAAEPERFLDRSGGGYASNDDRAGEHAATARPMPQGGNGHFDVFREDEVSVTSTLFVGGGWRWRLCDGEGLVVAEAGGYSDEAQCRAAVSAIQAHAAFASVR